MSDLPPGWEWTTIGHLTLPVSKVDPRSEPDREFDYIDIGGVDGDHGEILETQRLAGRDAPSRARQLVRVGDTVLSTVRTYMRKTALVSSRLDGQVASTGFSVLRPAEGVNPMYLYHSVRRQEFVATLSSLQTGSSYPAVRDKDVRSMPIPLAPKSAQERIVAAIEEHLSRLDAAAVMVSAAERRVLGLVERAWPSAEERDWPQVPLGDLLTVRDGKHLRQGWSPRCERHPSPDESTWGVLKTSAVQPARFVEAENKALPASQDPRPDLEVADGDFLMTSGGPRSRLGVTCIVRSPRSRLMASDKMFKFQPDAEQIDPAFLLAYLNSPSGLRSLERLKTGSNDSGLRISQSAFQALPVPVPPMPRQWEVVEHLASIAGGSARLSSEIEAAVRRSEQLRRAILAAAFSGQLVAQDPTDEPAFALLERICAERAAAILTRRTRKAKAS